MPSKVWDEFNSPFPNFNGWDVGSLGKEKIFHLTLCNRCNYLSMQGLKLIHVSKRDSWCVFFLHTPHNSFSTVLCEGNNWNINWEFWLCPTVVLRLLGSIHIGQVTEVRLPFVTWFCYQLIAKPGNKIATPPWPDPYTCFCTTIFIIA